MSDRASNPESNIDVLDRVDARGRAAAAGLRGAVATMPVPDTPVRATRPWLRPALAMAGVLALVAGLVTVLVALANRPADVANPVAPDTRWVLDVPPDGFVVAGAAGPGKGLTGDTSSLIRFDLYTDVSDTARGAVWVSGPDAVGDIEGEPVDLGGVDGVLGDDWAIPGSRAVEFGAGSQRQVVAGRGVSDDLLVAAATEVAAGRPVLPVLPRGFDEYLDVSLLDTGVMAGIMLARDEVPEGVATVGYTREGDSESLVYLAVQPDSPRAQAMLAALFEAGPAVDGLPNGRIVRIGEELQAVVWESDGLLFAVAGTEPVEVLAAAARTARPASDEEWQRLTAMLDSAVDDGDRTVETVVPASIPGDLSKWSGEVGGRPWEVRLSVTEPDMVEVVLGGQVIWTDRRDEEVWMRVFDDGDITATYAIVPEGFPGSLEVTTTSGGSSLSPLSADTSPVRFAAHVVPSAEFVSARWSADGGETLFVDDSSVLAFQTVGDDSWRLAVARSTSGGSSTIGLFAESGPTADIVLADGPAGVTTAETGPTATGLGTIVASAPEPGWRLVVHLDDATALSRDVVVPALGGRAVAVVFVDNERIAFVDLIDPTGAVVQRHLCAAPPVDDTVPCQ
jgi:hypothetical protein